MRFLSLAVTFFLLATWINSSAQAQAPALRVSPPGLTLPASEPRGSLSLSTLGEGAVLIEATAYEWSQVDGRDLLEPTTELIVVPALSELVPGTEQILRIGLRQALGDLNIEKTYRILLTQLPDNSAGSESVGVQFLVQLSLPIFVVPPNAEPRTSVVLGFEETGLGVVTLTNSGTAHLRVASVSLVLENSPETILAHMGMPIYVLAGEDMTWELTPEMPFAGESVTVTVATDHGTFEYTSDTDPP